MIVLTIIVGTYCTVALCWLVAFGFNGARDFKACVRVAVRWPQMFWNYKRWNKDAMALHGY